jgi:hypothetical protein
MSTYNSGNFRNTHNQNFINSIDLRCNWDIMREQLMHQWALLSEQDLEMAGPDAARIAMLIERKYGIASRLIENYLLNFVRTMPL